jgi:hypothetical protein
MKKGALAVIVAVMILVLGTGMANALTTALRERGCVIPYATYNGAGVDTAVGITILDPTAGHGIYWSFYDANGVPLMSGSIPIATEKFDYSFSLANGLAGAHSGVVGWLLITWDDDGVLSPAEPGKILSAAAFLINLTSKDAAFLPVVPLNVNDYNLAAPITLLNPPVSPLIAMSYGQGTAFELFSRYLVSASGDPGTTLVVFTPLDAPVQWPLVAATSSTGAIQVLSPLNSTNHKLNVFDAKNIVPAGFTEGSIVIENVPTSPIGIQFSLTFSSVVGAEQTIIAVED